MTPPEESFLAALTSLWLRLSTVAVVGLLTVLALRLPTKELAGWRFYLNPAEVAFEVTVFAVFIALTGVAVGTLCAAAIAPILFYRQSSRRRVVEIANNRAAVAIVAFFDLWIALTSLTRWANLWGTPKVAVFACCFLAFAVALCIPRRREQLVTSLDGFLSARATSRAVLGTGLATADLLVAVEAAMGMTTPAAAPRPASRPAGPNILLITFDALSAEDMSLYGYRLPTTPHIDEFARRSSVFTNFYSASTFTTPSVATILTGLQPSEHHVYHLQGRLHGDSLGRTLPHLMRAAGYSTGASISNPFAYFLAQDLAADYDVMPGPPYRTWGVHALMGRRPATTPAGAVGRKPREGTPGSRSPLGLSAQSLGRMLPPPRRPHHIRVSAQRELRPGARDHGPATRRLLPMGSPAGAALALSSRRRPCGPISAGERDADLRTANWLHP